MKVSISKAAKEMGVAIGTLRRWEAVGKIEVERTPRGHRRYDLAKLKGIRPRAPPSTQATLCYARVSSHDQKSDLETQVAWLESYCAANGWTYDVVQDLGSGVNYHKRGLPLLIQRIRLGEAGRLVLTHQDRLLRFGPELVLALCAEFGVEVVIVHPSEQPVSLEDELTQDVLEIIAVFSARVSGSRSRQTKQRVEKLRQAAESL